MLPVQPANSAEFQQIGKRVRPNFGEFGQVWREFDQVLANLVDSGAVSTGVQRTWPILMRFRPVFSHLDQFSGDFEQCSAYAADAWANSTFVRQTLPTLGPSGSASAETAPERRTLAEIAPDLAKVCRRSMVKIARESAKFAEDCSESPEHRPSSLNTGVQTIGNCR